MQIPKINIDLEIPIEDINMKTHRTIEQMAPFGPSNSRPVFMIKGVIDNGSASNRSKIKSPQIGYY